MLLVVLAFSPFDEFDDQVEGDLAAARPIQLRVVDLTSVAT